MSPLLEAFEDRALELSAYFKFIELIEKESAALSLPKKQTWKVRKVDEKILRILKANFFLLLYNLVEASIREGFLSVYKAVEADGCSVKQLTPPLRKLWIDVEFTRISAATANQDSYRNIARKLVQNIADDVKATLDVTAMKFSGNLDAAKIRDVCDAHGVSHKTDKRTQGGEKLLVVKNKRNALAHGDLSFVECGRDYSMAELGKIKDQSFWYLKSILRNIEKFNANKTYRK
jgi:hypothetical protein